MKELGVDGLAIARVRIRFAAPDRPVASTSFQVFDGVDEKPVWNDRLAGGAEVQGGALPAGLVSAAQSSFQALVAHYRSGK
jgi:hypothetical protein